MIALNLCLMSISLILHNEAGHSSLSPHNSTVLSELLKFNSFVCSKLAY